MNFFSSHGFTFFFERANNTELVIDTIWFDFLLAALAGLFTTRLDCRRIRLLFNLEILLSRARKETNSSLRVYHKRYSLDRVGCVCWKHVQMHIVHYSRPDLSYIVVVVAATQSSMFYETQKIDKLRDGAVYELPLGSSKIIKIYDVTHVLKAA